MAQFKDINTEDDAYLALSWISDICDLDTYKLLNKFVKNKIVRIKISC